MISKETLKALRSYAASLGRRDKGMTTAEIGEALGTCDKKTRKLMRMMIESGQMRRSGVRDTQTLSGQSYPVSVYELVKGG